MSSAGPERGLSRRGGDEHRGTPAPGRPPRTSGLPAGACAGECGPSAPLHPRPALPSSRPSPSAPPPSTPTSFPATPSLSPRAAGRRVDARAPRRNGHPPPGRSAPSSAVSYWKLAGFALRVSCKAWFWGARASLNCVGGNAFQNLEFEIGPTFLPRSGSFGPRR